jgi:hypothetical protein
MQQTGQQHGGQPRTRLARGLGIVLGAAYALLALAATGRSVLQVVSYFDRAPVAYSLTALAAVVYIVATVALFAPGRIWWRVALVTITFELLFVLTVGTLTIVDTALFPEKTVWSLYGLYYGFVPLVLPVLGLIWLRYTHRHTGE